MSWLPPLSPSSFPSLSSTILPWNLRFRHRNLSASVCARPLWFLFTCFSCFACFSCSACSSFCFACFACLACFSFFVCFACFACFACFVCLLLQLAVFRSATCGRFLVARFLIARFFVAAALLCLLFFNSISNSDGVVFSFRFVVRGRRSSPLERLRGSICF